MERRCKYPRISELTVLQSNAGYYIGRLYYTSEDEYEPYSRESTYMYNEKMAYDALKNNTYIQNFN